MLTEFVSGLFTRKESCRRAPRLGRKALSALRFRPFALRKYELSGLMCRRRTVFKGSNERVRRVVSPEGQVESVTSLLRIFRESIETSLPRLRHLPQALGLVWQAGRRWTLLWGGLLFAQGLLPVAQVYLAKELVDELTRVLAAGDESFDRVFWIVSILAILLFVGHFLSGLSDWVRLAQAETAQDHIQDLIHQQATRLDLSHYESPLYHDRLHRALGEGAKGPLSLLETLGGLGQSSLTLIAMLIVLTRFGPWIPVALLATTLPGFYLIVHYAGARRRWRLENTHKDRKSRYLHWVLISLQAAAEVRLFDLGSYFGREYQVYRQELRQSRLTLESNETRNRLAIALVTSIVTAICLIWMVGRVGRGVYTLGELVLFYQAFSQGQRLLHAITGRLGEIYYSLLYLDDLFLFLQLPSRLSEPAAPVAVPDLRQGVALEGVSFRYGDSDRWALKDFDMFIPVGKTVALIGPNGAGKSTLLKLICRFYDSDEERITWDGTDLRDFSSNQLRGCISAIFQQPLQYHLTARGNIEVAEGSTGRQFSPADSEAAARRAGAHKLISQLPQGYDTHLGRWLMEGEELSVGEWQRIGLARALFRKVPLLLLDEPTSAMDPWSEAEWMGQLNKVLGNRTALLITHRVTTARFAALISVLINGRIEESGSHQELVRFGGYYAQLWKSWKDSNPPQNSSS